MEWASASLVAPGLSTLSSSKLSYWLGKRSLRRRNTLVVQGELKNIDGAGWRPRQRSQEKWMRPSEVMQRSRVVLLGE